MKNDLKDTVGGEVAKATKEKKVKATKEKKSLYALSLDINNQLLEVSASTIEEALKGLQGKIPSFVKTKAVLKVVKDGKSSERFLNRHDIRRLFTSKSLIMVIAKRLELSMK